MLLQFEAVPLSKYLGVMIGFKRLVKSSYNEALERITGRLACWKASALSFAGKVVLLQSVI